MSNKLRLKTHTKYYSPTSTLTTSPPPSFSITCRKESLPQLRNTIKQMVETANRLERLQKQHQQSSPGTPRLILRKQRDQLREQIHVLKDKIDKMVLLPLWLERLSPEAAHSWTSTKGKKYKRVTKIPDELFKIAINLMVNIHSHTYRSNIYPQTLSHSHRSTIMWRRFVSRACWSRHGTVLFPTWNNTT